MGLIHQAVPDNEWDTAVDALAQKLASMPTKGLGLTKRALHASQDNNLHEQLALELDLQFEAAETEDYAEGVQAFLDKRPAQFTGR
jgi:2-(1,2-epoxy-1,2-dihydrophenyl)acetyl-CoA isomerase